MSFKIDAINWASLGSALALDAALELFVDITNFVGKEINQRTANIPGFN